MNAYQRPQKRRRIVRRFLTAWKTYEDDDPADEADDSDRYPDHVPSSSSGSSTGMTTVIYPANWVKYSEPAYTAYTDDEAPRAPRPSPDLR